MAGVLISLIRYMLIPITISPIKMVIKGLDRGLQYWFLFWQYLVAKPNSSTDFLEWVLVIRLDIVQYFTLLVCWYGFSMRFFLDKKRSVIFIHLLTFQSVEVTLKLNTVFHKFKDFHCPILTTDLKKEAMTTWDFHHCLWLKQENIRPLRD